MRFTSTNFSALPLAIFCCVLLRATTVSAWQAEPTPAQQTPGVNITQVAHLSDVRPASFKEITPGISTVKEVTAKLGPPARQIDGDDSASLSYDIPPFADVEIAVSDGVVTSIVLRFDEPAELSAIAKGLGLSPFRPAPIPDENSRLLGQVYPERGILFGFAENDPAQRIEHIVLEPITAEPFILRALYDADHRYSESLADLEYAARLDESDSRIYAHKAAILSVLGRISDALANAQLAAELEEDNPQYRLAYAQLLALVGKYDEAITATQQTIEDETTPVELKARGQCQLGDLLAEGPQNDYPKAISHHMAAIQSALPLATDKSSQVRRRAKRVLIDAHLAVAGDIANGRWSRKSEVVPKWLARADALVVEMIKNDGGDVGLKLLVQRRTLAAQTQLKGELDPTAAIEAVINDGRRMIAAAADPLYKQQLEWQLGESLLNAALVERARGQHEISLQYANNALALLSQARGDRQTPHGRDDVLGQVYFFIGSHYAVHGEDHAEAVSWYEKAAPHYAQPLPEWAATEIGRRGEQFVSMGVSYWQTEDYERGMQLTQQGVQFIQQSVEAGALQTSALAIPYGNLARMLKQTGNDEEAARLARRAAELETAAGASQQR